MSDFSELYDEDMLPMGEDGDIDDFESDEDENEEGDEADLMEELFAWNCQRPLMPPLEQGEFIM